MRESTPAADALLDRYFPVLDHGFVALKDYMGGDRTVETFARTSYLIGEEDRTPKQTRDLIRYLVRHKHTTPVESTVLTFHIGMPIFVARQWIRHRMATTNEFSGRYSEMPTIFYTPENDRVCGQSDANRQGSGEPVDPVTYHEFTWEHSFNNRDDVRRSYEWSLGRGIARETARIDLPLSTYTYFYWKIDLHNLMHFISLRSEDHAQWEIRRFSDVVAGMARAVAPICFEAFIDYKFEAETFSRMEMGLLRTLIESHRDLLDVHDSDLRADLDSAGVGGRREQDEFLAKLSPKVRKSFGLDEASAKDGRHFFDKARADR